MKLEHVLAAIDFSPASERVLKEAERIAFKEGADLTALHVIDSDIEQQLRQVYPHLTEGDVVERARAHLADSLEKTAGGEFPIRSEVALGHPFDEIVSAVGAHRVDLLVMGSKGLSHRDDVTGFTAAKCVRKSPAKVLLVRERHQGPYRKIVACVDFSETADLAVQHAVHLARQDGAQLELLHVVRKLHLGMLGLDYLSLDLESAPTFEKSPPNLEREVQERLRSQPEDTSGLDISIAIVESPSIGRGVIEHLNETGADLVVMGTRGRTGLNRLLMGTIAEKVIHSSPCSVLAIKPEGFEYHHVSV